MGMLKEFKDFAMKGNVVDMAVGIVIGAAFGKIVASLVGDVLMPPIGMLLGSVDFSSLSFPLNHPVDPQDLVTIRYGAFINTIIDFVIVALAIFLVVKQMNRLQPAPAAAAATTKDCPHCQMSVPVKATRCGHCTSDLRAASI